VGYLAEGRSLGLRAESSDREIQREIGDFNEILRVILARMVEVVDSYEA